jgi:hypothetical protein
MPSEERLLGLLLEAARMRNDAVRAMNGSAGEALDALSMLAASARQAYNECREVLEVHERSHGCTRELHDPPAKPPMLNA